MVISATGDNLVIPAAENKLVTPDADDLVFLAGYKLGNSAEVIWLSMLDTICYPYLTLRKIAI